MQVPEEQEEQPMGELLMDSFLIAGGALIVIGSFSPWTYGKVADFVYYRNGMQLGFNQSFSIAGLLTLIFGAHAVLTGALHLAERQRFRIFSRLPTLDGLVGVVIGLYGLGEATWYVHQMTGTYSQLFGAGASYGIWLVLGGGAPILIASLAKSAFLRNGLQRVLGVAVISIAIGVTAFALAPK